MEDRFAQQMKKGILEMLVLQTLCRSPGHGYELINRLKTRSGGLFTMKEGTLYPILYRLEDEGLIRASWAQDRAAPKKVYEPRQIRASAADYRAAGTGLYRHRPLRCQGRRAQNFRPRTARQSSACQLHRLRPGFFACI